MEPLPDHEGSTRPARRILAIACLIHVALFLLQARGQFAALATARPVTPLSEIKVADSMGYYAWLRSPLIDGDFQFDNEFAATFTYVPGGSASWPRTPKGRPINPWPVGPAILWSPAVLAVHLILIGLGDYSPWPADGYSPPYQLAVAGTTFMLALLTLWLAYQIGRRFAGRSAAAAAAAVITLGTPIVAYGTVFVDMSHGAATAALAMFVFVWLRTLESLRLVRWMGLGASLGLACLMRWQLATFAVFPVLEAICLMIGARSWLGRFSVAARLAGAGVASVVVFLPQMLAWNLLFGRPVEGFYAPALNWLHPALWTVLMSTDRSLFYSTPVALPALAGLTWAAARPAGLQRMPLLALLVAVAVQIYTIAAILGGSVYLGASFGFRFLSETCILLVPGAAVLFDRGKPRMTRGLTAGAGLLVAWNLLLLVVFRQDLRGGKDLILVVSLVARHFRRRPLEAIGIVLLAGWLTYVMVARRREEHSPALVTDSEPPKALDA